MNKPIEVPDKYIPVMLEYYTLMSEWTAYNALLMKCRTQAYAMNNLKKYELLSSVLNEATDLYKSQMSQLRDNSEGLLEEVCKLLEVNLDTLVK